MLQTYESKKLLQFVFSENLINRLINEFLKFIPTKGAPEFIKPAIVEKIVVIIGNLVNYHLIANSLPGTPVTGYFLLTFFRIWTDFTADWNFNVYLFFFSFEN